jgi:ribonuclease HI
MELRAVIEGLRALKGPCALTIFTDSQYVQRGVTEWMEVWKVNGWRTSKRRGGGKVLNRDLWDELDQRLSLHSVEWMWVKGHADDVDNIRCDMLANRAARDQTSSDGVVSSH